MRTLLLSASLMLLAACAAPQNNGGMKAAEPPPAMAVDQKAAVEEKAVVDEKVVAVDEKAVAATPGAVDFSCKTDGDCKIKDVGSCCGYRPACVNKDSKTFPAQVKAECAKKGMASTCGFPSISSCTCTNNKCEGVSGPGGEAQIR